MSMSPLAMQKMIPLLIALLILCISSISAAINTNNARHNQLRQPSKGTDRITLSSTIPRSLQLLNLKQPNRNKNKTARPDKTKRPTELKNPSPTSSPSIDSLSPSIDSLEELPLDNDTNSTADEDATFSASSVDNETHNPNDAVIDDGESLTDVYVVEDSSLEEDFIHRPLTGGNDKPIISSSEDMSKDTVEDIFSSSTKTINVGPFDMTFTMYNKDVAQPNKKKLLRLLQAKVEKKDTLEQIASDLYSIAARDHLAAIYEATFSYTPSFNVKFEDEEKTSMSQETFYNSKFDVDFYYDESNANGDIPSEDELKQMILLAFTDEKNKEQFYQRFHDLYANDSNVQQIESVGEIGGTGAGELLKKLYNVNVQEAGLVTQEDEANIVSEATSEATPSSSDSSDSGISTGLLVALTVLSCAIIIVAIVGFTVYWKKYHRSSNENRSGSEEPKYWTPLNDEAEVADDLALVESNDLEQQQEYDMNIMSQMQVEDTPGPGRSIPVYGGANQETTQEVSSPYHNSIQYHSQNQQEQLGSNQDISELHEGSVVSGWSMSEVADHDDTTNVDDYNTDDDGISLSNTSLVGAGELFRTVMRYDDTDDDEGQKVVPDMGTDKLNTTAETEIVEDYDEDFLGYVVDNDDDDSESRGAFIKEILSRSDEEEDGGEENDFL